MEDQAAQQEKVVDDSAKSEKLLYHYTDQKGLDGILESGCMWATHYCFLNDISERRIGFDVYSKVIEKAIKSKKKLFPEGPDVWNKVLQGYFEANVAYIIYFSKDHNEENAGQAGDRLSQWRGYAFGKQGYCMGFRRQKIEEIVRALPCTLHLGGFLVDCIYSKEAMTDKIEVSTNKFLDNMMAIKNSYFKTHPSEMSYRPYDDLDACAAIRKYACEMLLQCSIFKHPSFEEENETRLIAFFVKRGSADSSLIEFYTGRSGQIPYIKIPIGARQQTSSLEKITIAPSSNMEQAIARLKVRLTQIGLPCVEVVPSNIPYRNW